MRKKSDFTAGILLSCSHFAVDLSCTALLTAYACRDGKTALLCALVYNGFAFAFQLPIGALADSWKKNRLFAVVGCLLVACGAFALRYPLLLSIIIGLGNAFFHVGGGREALLRGGKKAAMIGHFVAPGALGIFLGPLLATRSAHTGQLFPALCLLCALLLLLLRQGESRTEALRIPQSPQSSGTFLRITVCMFLTVLLRAYMGSIIRYPFQSTFLMALLFVLCILAGKFLGGRFADRFGAFSFSLVAQLAATALFVFSLWHPYCAYPAIFLFNTTMAITAHRLYRLSPAYGGTMFGLTTLALYLGTLPKILGWANPFFTWWGLLLLGLLSTALLLLGLVPRGGDADA